MKSLSLGKTGFTVSNLCLGTMQFGWTADEAASFAVMDAFVAAGGNFIDTADIYSNWAPGNEGGVSEEIIGRWMTTRGNRDRLIIATKVRGPMWTGADGEGLHRAHLSRAIDDSLRRLQVETIDLYQCHWPDNDTAIEETLVVFGEMIAAGKVRHIGASNFDAGRLADALRVAGETGSPRFATLQPHHNLVHRREYEAALAALCEREGIGVIPYSPLGGGFLTGKYRRDRTPESARAGGVKKYLTEDGFRALDALDAVAAAHGTSVAAAALAWQMTRPAVAAPIIGANTPEQLAELVPASELVLTAEDIAALDGVTTTM